MNQDPKVAYGENKPPLALVPLAGIEECAKVFAKGKYPPRNWVQTDVEIMTYLNAILRHTYAILEGEDTDSDSGLPHLGHLIANAAIILDAKKHGTLLDNRVLPPVKQP